MRKLIIAVVVSVAVLAAAGTVVAQSTQRFPDVPPDHDAFEAINWAVEIGLTTGYTDGTFKPEQPLSKRHAGVFMERYYDLILQADESSDFTRGDMMRVLKAIEDGGSAGPANGGATPEEPDTTTGRWIPNPENRSAGGRCAPAVVMGIYDWEGCAWGVSPDPEMSRSEMLSLTEKVWAETKARGKPDEQPNLAEGYCGEDTLGCYLASTHTIQLSDGFTRRTLLHELAHALISDNESTRACGNDWTHRQPECWHGDWYRCAADALYVRYGGITTAGVCGQAPSLTPGNWYLWQPSEVEWGIIHAAAAVFDENAAYWLNVRCETDFTTGETNKFSVLMSLPRDISGDTVKVSFRFSDERSLSDSSWSAFEALDVVFWTEDTAAFMGRFSGADKLYMSIEYGERDVDRLTFDLGDSPALSIVKSACG